MSHNSTTKRLKNTELAELLRDVAAAYQLKDGMKYRFQMIAYQKAADAIEHATSDLVDIWEEGNITDVPGIGKSIAEHLNELFEKGKSQHFEDLLAPLPEAMFELMKVPGIGPKKAFKLATEFKLTRKNAFTALLKVASEGKIAELPGYGEESQADIIQGIKEYQVKAPERMLISTAYELATEIIEWLKEDTAVIEANSLGSLRRRAATVGDLDIAVATNDPERVFDRFVAFPKTARVIERGGHSTSILLPGNIQVDVMVQPPEAYGSLLQHFTGSKHHNIALREFALKKNLSLSEYGIKEDRGQGKLHTFENEEKFYNFLGFKFIPPELREDTGELDPDAHLPNLVTEKDIMGDLQMHSSYDIETSHDIGGSSMQELSKRAQELGYEYIAVTEHNPSQKGHNQKQISDILKGKKEYIDKLNYSFVNTVKSRVFKVFNSLEIDILPSGALPVNDEGLELLDFALVSIHSSFKQPKLDMTKRVLSALAHPKVKIFAHPSARLINHRDSIDLEWEKIFEYCAENKKFIEINADPHRLDLPDSLVRQAKKYGVMFSLGTDAHHALGLDNMKYGVFVARRGWLTASDILNTRNLSEFEKLIG